MKKTDEKKAESGPVGRRRRQWPFLTYGGTYDILKKKLEFAEWLVEWLRTHRPTTMTDHDWFRFEFHLKNMVNYNKQLFSKLPEPTEEQRKEIDIDEVAPWPEDSMPLIDKTWEHSFGNLEIYTEKAAAVVLETRYTHDKLGSKYEKSPEQCVKEWEKKRSST